MKMNIYVFIVILVVIFVGPNIVQAILRSIISKKLTKYLMEQDYDTFYKKIDTWAAKFSINPFNRDYMKLNAAFIQKDKALINEQIVTMDTHRRLNEKQKYVFYRNVFGYYVNEDNKQKAKYFLEKLKTLKNEKVGQEAELIYKVEIEKSTKELENTLKELETASLKDREFLLSMISRMYSLKGDEENAEKYLAMIEEPVEDL